jgi:hypothetical protein
VEVELESASTTRLGKMSVPIDTRLELLILDEEEEMLIFQPPPPILE